MINRLLELIDETDRKWKCMEHPDESIAECYNKYGCKYCLKKEMFLAIKSQADIIKLNT